MTNFENKEEQRDKWREERTKWREEFRAGIRGRYSNPGMRYGGGRKWTGLVILLIGITALLYKADLIPPGMEWIFSWPMLIIAIGLMIGFRCRFHGIAWLILLLVGGFFLADDINPDSGMNQYIWPLVLICLGLFFIFRSGRLYGKTTENKNATVSDIPADAAINPETTDSREDYIHATSVFGGTKKNILSKNFKGGDVVNIFGGTELNLNQADIQGEAVIEMTTIFGGTKLIIPPGWTVKSDAAVIFGGIEDKRNLPAVHETGGKTILLKGTVIFGGVDIKSY